MSAYVAGFEVETKFARGLHFHHYMKDWHPTATLGVFGAAVACARLFDLSEPQIGMALLSRSPRSSNCSGSSRLHLIRSRSTQKTIISAAK